MKLMKCFIPPCKIDDVKEALIAIGVHGMTVSDVRGIGRRNDDHHDTIRAGSYPGFTQNAEVQVFVPDQLARQALDAIMSSARTGQADDGKIFIMNVDQAVRIRTGESDDNAL